MYDIIIKKAEGKQEILLLENGILTERIVEDSKMENLEGNIYVGKVQNILPGMQAAFIDIGEEKNTFIHVKDAIPKVNEAEQDKEEQNIKISDVLKPGMPLMVQVKKTEANRKGARVSTHINLSGKYIVLMPNANFVTISQKIENKEEKDRLKNIVREILPPDMGAIIRTAAVNKEKEELLEDVEMLKSEWIKIVDKKENASGFPIQLYNGSNSIKRIVLDLIEKDVRSITINNESDYEELKALLKDIKKIPIIINPKAGETSDIEKQIENMENRKIWLKSGGFITIDKTEALTAIDVNSGKYTGGKSLEQTIFTVNKEATMEIAKQLKLRDIGGIIIIDYIDMNDKKNKEKIEELMKEELKKDRSKTQVLGFTALNLLELTRKHIN